MDRLIEMLDEELRLLDELDHRLFTLDCLVAGGEVDLLPGASDDADRALLAARHQELLRSLEMARCVEARGLDLYASLRDLADAVDEPHARRLRRLALQITERRLVVEERSASIRHRTSGPLEIVPDPDRRSMNER